MEYFCAVGAIARFVQLFHNDAQFHAISFVKEFFLIGEKTQILSKIYSDYGRYCGVSLKAPYEYGGQGPYTGVF